MASSKPFMTSSKVARLCGVSGRTVLKWIAQGRLKAHKLPSGHYRIHEDVVQAFMANREDQPGSALDVTMGESPYCWTRQPSSHAIQCVNCLVRRIYAVHCFVLRAQVGDEHMQCAQPCDECAFYREIGTISEVLEFDSEPCVVARAGIVLGVNSAFRDLCQLGDRQVIGMGWDQFAPVEELENLAVRFKGIYERGADGVYHIDTLLLRQRDEPFLVTLELTRFRRLMDGMLARVLLR